LIGDVFLFERIQHSKLFKLRVVCVSENSFHRRFGFSLPKTPISTSRKNCFSKFSKRLFSHSRVD
jgi:hypothetical protein